MKQFKLGLGVDGLLADTENYFQYYKDNVGSTSDFYLDRKMIKDESFWRSLPPLPDVWEAARRLTEARVEVYALTERHASLVPLTWAWLKVAGFAAITMDQVVPQSLKRYDSRLLNLGVLCDSDLAALRTFVYDETEPVYINRCGEEAPLSIRSFDYLDEAITYCLESV